MDQACNTLAGTSMVSTALDPVVLRQHLEVRLSIPAGWGALGAVEVQVLKSHRNRSTAAILFHTATGPHTVIGKVYREDRSDVYRAMEAIAGAGFGPKTEFSIPQPIAYVPELKLLLQENVDGVRAKDIFVSGNDHERAEAAERCALWLARFHAAAPRLGPVLAMDRYFRSLHEWSQRIATAGEPLAEQAACLVGRMKAMASRLGRIEMCAGHGSYCHAQIIMQNGRTVTYDWDGYDVADPSRDVALALGRLAMRQLGSMHALAAAAGIFRQTYRNASRCEIEPSLPFYKAGACLKIAKFEISRPACPSRQAVIEAMLDEGFRSLEAC